MRSEPLSTLSPRLEECDARARVVGCRLCKVAATWSAREIQQLELSWRVVEESSDGSGRRVVKTIARRFPDLPFSGANTSQVALDLDEGDHVLGLECFFQVVPGALRSFNSTTTREAYRLVEVAARATRGCFAVTRASRESWWGHPLETRGGATSRERGERSPERASRRRKARHPF